MCRLVGWVSSTPISLAQALGDDGLHGLTALSRQHADGWGLAWEQDGELRTVGSHLAAHVTPEYREAATSVRADAGLVHLRWATPGLPVVPENTHPVLADGWAFGHNGAVRPADGLLDLLGPDEVAALRGTTDSERLMHVLLARVGAHGLEEGLRRTVADVGADLTPSSLNLLLLGRDALTAACCHGAPEEGDPLVEGGPPEDRPGYFDLRWYEQDGLVVVASEPLGAHPWRRLPNGSALVVERGSLCARTVEVGALPPGALARERDRRTGSVSAA